MHECGLIALSRYEYIAYLGYREFPSEKWYLASLMVAQGNTALYTTWPDGQKQQCIASGGLQQKFRIIRET